LALAGYETDAGIRTDAAGVDLYFTRHAKYSYLTNSLELLKMQFSSSGERSTVDRDIKSCLRSSVYEAAIIDSILIGNKTEKFDFSKNAEQFIFLHGYAPASGGFIAICLR
jgi:hypothetical protein